MKSKATRLSVAVSALVGLAATLLPFCPAEAQWVFVARKALGRIQHMREENQPGGRPGYDFASACNEINELLELSAANHLKYWGTVSRPAEIEYVDQAGGEGPAGAARSRSTAPPHAGCRLPGAGRQGARDQ